MASWTDLSSAFGANTILTSAQQQQLRDNITAAFEKASGAPILADEYVTSGMITDAVVEAHVSDGFITTPKLDISLIPKVSKLIFTDGTSASTLNVEMVNVMSGDTIAATDNIAKGATTGNFTLSADGKTFTVEASGLSGNCNGVNAAGYSYSDPTNYYQGVLPYASSNDIVLELPFDAPFRIDTESSFVIWVNYRTNA